MQPFRVSKKNGKLIFNDLGGYETRNPSTFWCIQKSDEIYNFNDFKEIEIYTGDYEKDTNSYTYSKRNAYTNLVPDFNFHAWPQVGIYDYEDFVKEIDNAGLTPHEINKVGWIGNTDTHILRKCLFYIGNKNQDILDIMSMRWSASDNVMLNSTSYISTPELVKKYGILLDIEGNGYSGRLKHLLWSHRPILLVDRPHKEFFYEHLQEWIHYIPVKRDLSDLVEKTRWCLDNYDKGQQIAENAYQFSKIHLTRSACYEKWRDIIQSNYD
jgi:hypothetical protein